ncbi:fimbria/pilus outer membrane usher protein [Thalassotalea maritima]|uniref:fimbria/pilus outer membrane usher protein n=1 Tax=Thalassotalea maritima TaxID=3242416 RepID=UPI003529BB95
MVFSQTDQQRLTQWRCCHGRHRIYLVAVTALNVTLASAPSFVIAQKNDNPSSARSQTVTQEQKEQFFRQAFGVDIPEVWYKDSLLIIVNNEITQSLPAEINPYSQAVRLDGMQVMELIRLYLKPDAELDLQAFITTTGFADFESLQQQGFSFRLNRRSNTFEIQLPGALSRLQTLDAGQDYKAQSKQRAYLPEPVSGFINAYSYHGDTRDANGDRRYAGQTRFESNLNINGLVFQHEGNYTNTGETSYWQNSALRMIYTQHELAQHIIIGEQSPLDANWSLQPAPTSGSFAERLVGIGVNKRVSLSDFARTTNNFQYNFVLEQGAEIQVFVNNKLVYQKQLTPGDYNLKGLPLEQGENDIQIVIYKDDGQVDDFTDTFYNSPSLLGEGEREWQFAAGYLYEGPYDLTRLDEQNPLMYGMYRMGLSSYFGIAPYFQYQENRQFLGVLAQLGTSFGQINLDLSQSNDSVVGTGSAIRLELLGEPSYRPFGFFNNSYRSFSVTAEAYSENYTATAVSASSEDSNARLPYRWSINPALEIGFSDKMRLSISAIYSKVNQADNQQNNFRYNIRLLHRWRQLDFGLEFQRGAETFLGQDENQLNFNITYNGSSGRKYLRAEHNTANRSESLQATFRPQSNRQMQYQVDLRKLSENSYLRRVGVSYRDGYVNRSLTIESRANFGVEKKSIAAGWQGARGAIYSYLTDDENAANMGFVGIESALVFAGNKFAIARPVDDSFAILYPAEGLKGSNIVFNNRAQIDWLGPAVVSNLNSYQNTGISVEESHAPVGADLGSGYFYVKPSYASGTAIKIGQGGTLLLNGVLVDEKGEPYKLATGRIELLANEQSDKPKLFFTDEFGNFSILGLAAGRYQLIVDDEDYQPVELVIEQAEDGIIQVGTITVKKK